MITFLVELVTDLLPTVFLMDDNGVAASTSSISVSSWYPY
jgi:hypothetical protein